MLKKFFPLIISINLILLPCMAVISFQYFAAADVSPSKVMGEVSSVDIEQPDFSEAPLQGTVSPVSSVSAIETKDKEEIIAPVFYHSTIYDANGEPKNQFTVQAGSARIEKGSIINTITYVNDIEIGKITLTVAEGIAPFSTVTYNLSVGIPKDLTKFSDKTTASVYINDIRLGLGDSKNNTIKTLDTENIKTVNFSVPIPEGLLEVLNAEQTLTSISSDDISANISIIYDNITYQERVLIPGKQLTALLDITNNTSVPKDVNLILALYDGNSKIISSHVFPCHFNGNDSDTFTGFVNVPSDNSAAFAKIMVWDASCLMPYCDPVVLIPKINAAKAFSTIVNGAEYYSDMSDNGSLYKDDTKVYNPLSTWLSAGSSFVYFNSDGLKSLNTVNDTVDSLCNGNPYYIVSDGNNIFYADWNDGGRIYKYTSGAPILVCKDSALNLEINGDYLHYKNVKDGGKLYRVLKTAENESGTEIE